MILEIADIHILPNSGSAFEAAVADAAPLFKQAPGCLSMTLRRSIEQADRYNLLVKWETLEDHTVHFRSSEAFQNWRRLASPFFAATPVVTHWDATAAGF